MNIIQARIVRNYTPGKQGYTPEGVYVHTYNGKGRNLENWFNNVLAQVSATASVVDTGDIYEYLDDMDTAWANGNWDANLKFLSLEHWDNGVPSDKVRTNELYEASAQWIASKYKKFNWDKENMGLIKPHWEAASTGCPGALDIDRIRARVYEILHPAPAIPAWKQNAKDIGATNFTVEKDVNLVNFLNGEIVLPIAKGTVIGVRYLTQGFYMTESSYQGNRPTGFKKEDLEYKEPRPDIILYLVRVGILQEENFETIEQAREFYDKGKELLLPGETVILTKFNQTQNERLEVESYTKPIPEPDPDPVDPEPDPTDPVEPVPPTQNGIRWIVNFIFNLLKSVYERIFGKRK